MHQESLQGHIPPCYQRFTLPGECGVSKFLCGVSIAPALSIPDESCFNLQVVAIESLFVLFITYGTLGYQEFLAGRLLASLRAQASLEMSRTLYGTGRPP